MAGLKSCATVAMSALPLRSVRVTVGSVPVNVGSVRVAVASDTRLEAIEALLRKPDGSERRSSALFVAVVVGPTRDEDAVPVGELQISAGRRRVVFAVKRLNSRQTGVDHARDQVVAFQQAGVRKRRNAACMIDDADDVGRRRSTARDEGRLSFADQLIE